MKTRNDFVSNSSSCSFIVKINSQEDKDVLEKILKSYDACLSVSYDIDSYDFHIIENIQDSDIGHFVEVNLGEDDLETIDRFEDIKDDIETSQHKFDIYADSLAHYTFGKNSK